jgi:hypothetical protein
MEKVTFAYMPYDLFQGTTEDLKTTRSNLDVPEKPP